MTETRIPKTFTVLPHDKPGTFATINGQRVLEPTIATEDDQLGIEIESIPLNIGLGSMADPLNWDALRSS